MSSSLNTDFQTIEALPILLLNDDDNIKLYIKNLQKIFLDPRIINSKIMIISICGPQRTGKSFLMNYCIRYLRKKRIESLISNHDLLTGFEWGSFTKSQNSGIYIWNEPYFTETVNKSKVAVILLDCQGSFENKASVKEIVSLYAFCNLLSSLQIYNLFNQMTEIYLQWTAFISNYANLFQSKNNENSEYSHIYGQCILFLLRDWSYSYEYFYGAAGGQQYINKFLFTQQKDLPSQNIYVREFLMSQYKSINCFLMPHIGLEVASSDCFDGRWDFLSADFQDQLHNFMKHLFSPNNIITKEIEDEFVTGRQICSFAEQYYNEIIFIKNLEPSTIFNASAKSYHYKAVYEGLDFYNKKIKSRHLYCKDINILLGFHNTCKISTLQKYDDENKFGNILFSEKFREILRKQIDNEFIRYYAFNPVKPEMVTAMLSVIIISIVFMTILGLIKLILYSFDIYFFLNEINIFILISVSVLIIFCLCSFKKLYGKLNFNTEMQNALRNQL